MRKGGFVNMDTVLKDKYITLLPEYYLRPYEPDYISYSDLNEKIEELAQKLGVEL